MDFGADLVKLLHVEVIWVKTLYGGKVVKFDEVHVHCGEGP